MKEMMLRIIRPRDNFFGLNPRIRPAIASLCHAVCLGILYGLQKPCVLSRNSSLPSGGLSACEGPPEGGGAQFSSIHARQKEDSL